MKCRYCRREWTPGSGFPVNLTSCPFCGEPLRPETVSAGGMAGIIAQIRTDYGLEVLRSDRLPAYFADLAPAMDREQTMLLYLVRCGGHCSLTEVLQEPEPVQRAAHARIIRRLCDELLMGPDAAKETVASFWAGLGGKAFSALSEASAPAAGSQSDMTAVSAEDLFDAACRAYHSAEPDWVKAKEAFQKAAGMGHADSQYYLGWLCAHGQGTPKDPQAAAVWYGKAAAQGQADAMLCLGCCYYHGDGMETDRDQALYWFRQAAEKGSVVGMFNTGTLLHTSEPKNAADWYTRAAQHGHKEALYWLGMLYADTGSVLYDPKQAQHWLTEVAEKGIDAANAALARLERLCDRGSP